MGAFPFFTSSSSEVIGLTTSGATAGVTVTASGTTHTKGSWTQLSAATTRPATGIQLYVKSSYALQARFLVDIGIGSASSEVVLVPNLYFRGESDRGHFWTVFVPVAVPAGTRISARVQCGVGSQSVVVAARMVDRGAILPGFSGADNYGPDASITDIGFYQTSGTSNNTKCAWQELTAATTRDYRGLVTQLGMYVGSGSPIAAFDLAVGASGSEQIVLPDIVFGSDTAELSDVQWEFHPLNIPAGTRLAWRAQTSSVHASNYFLFSVLGLY